MKKEKNELQDDVVVDINTKKVFKLSLIGLVITCILLLFSIIFRSNVSPLSQLSFTGFLILVLFSLIFFILFTILSKKELVKDLKVKNFLFKLFDNLSYVLKFLLVFCFCITYIFSFVRVSGSSMQNTYNNNDLIMIYSFNYKPSLNDVVVIDTSKQLSDSDFIIKRIVATSSDTIDYYNNSLYVNDEFVEEMNIDTYYSLLTDYSTNTTYSSVPNNYSIVLGDNRDNSVDSRIIGLICNDNIIGKSIFRIFPFSNIGVPKKE